MNLVIALLVIAAAAAAAVTVMLLVRRRAPDGGYFNDGDRAAGVFGVVATGFSVLLGFVVFLAFASYDAARAGAEDEARVVAQQIETAQLLPHRVSDELTIELVCYARSVAGVQWDRMQDGTLGEDLNPWAVALFRSLETVDPQTTTEQAAYSQWLEQDSAREEARQSRVHGAVGVIPTPLWIVLFFVTAVIFVFMLFFADSGERAVVQGMLIGSVVAVICAMLLLLYALDHPFHDGVGGLKPVAMERTLEIIDQTLQVTGQSLTLPCDAEGVATR
jgi:amino acid transporter